MKMTKVFVMALKTAFQFPGIVLGNRNESDRKINLLALISWIVGSTGIFGLVAVFDSLAGTTVTVSSPSGVLEMSWQGAFPVGVDTTTSIFITSGLLVGTAFLVLFAVCLWTAKNMPRAYFNE